MNNEFKRCIDFLTRMVEKYGDKLALEIDAGNITLPNTERTENNKHKDSSEDHNVCP